ncbi:hypothetical protein GCM10010307_39320 [Streptomyces vastus]|uniref:Uncharacterized protein n=1 Tax=Streptomyces vastus TaxID=285451 RepID=A0ABN3QZV7_9ACTN
MRGFFTDLHYWSPLPGGPVAKSVNTLPESVHAFHVGLLRRGHTVSGGTATVTSSDDGINARRAARRQAGTYRHALGGDAPTRASASC